MNKGYYKNSQFAHLWLHLLLRASYCKREFLFNGKIERLNPGQFITGRNILAKETGINRNKIERILKTFENEQQIEQQATNKFRIITILNWEPYQSGEQQNEQQVSSKRAASEQQVSTINKDKKEKKDKKVYSPTSEEVRLSELLFSKIQTRNAGFKQPDFQKWAIHIDKLMRIDKKTGVEIQKVIEWCQEDSFWQNNILSTDKLRAKYDALNTKRLSGGSNGNRSYQGRGSNFGYGRRDRGADELPPDVAAELAARIKRINDKV